MKRIILVADCKGWCFWHMAQGIRAYAPPEYEVHVMDGEEFSRIPDRADYLDSFDAVCQFAWYEAETKLNCRNSVLLAHHGAEHAFPQPPDGNFHRLLSTKLRNCETAAQKFPEFSEVICVSQRLLPVARRFTAHATYCHPGVDHNMFSPEVIPYGSSPLRVAWCGQQSSPQKGHARVLKPVMERMSGRCEFVINGRTSRNPLDQRGMAEFYQSCDLFLSTSFSEGCTMPPVEAASCGLPVVATKCGAVDELVDDGETGFIASSYHDDESADIAVDELCRILKWCCENRDAVRVMGERSRSRILGEFSWEVRAPEWCRLIAGDA